MNIKKIVGRKLVDYELPIRYELFAYFKVKKDLFDNLEERLKDTSYWLEGGALISAKNNGEDGMALVFTYRKSLEVKEIHIPWEVVNNWDAK